MLRNVFIVRHADSENHRNGEITVGQTDHSLIPRGLLQSKAVAATLAELGISSPTRLFSSDVKRASQTAAAVERLLGIPCEQYRQLREIHRGAAEGMTASEAEKIAFPHTTPGIDLIPYPEAESWRMMNNRVVELLDTVFDERDTENLIIVTHGNPCVVCVHWWLMLPEVLWTRISYEFDRGSVTYLTINTWGERTIRFLNSTTHLHSIS